MKRPASDHRSVRVRRDPHPRADAARRTAPCTVRARRPGRRPDPRDPRPLPGPRPGRRRRHRARRRRPVGDQGSDIARIAAIAAGLPDTVAGVQENRFCASGLEAVNPVAAKVRSGWEDLVLAGGVEVDVPGAHGVGRRRLVQRPDDQPRHQLRAPGHRRRPDRHHRGFTRRDVDEYAALSRSARPTPGRRTASSGPSCRSGDRAGLTVLDHDEHLRPGTTADSSRVSSRPSADIGELGGFDAVALQKYHWVEQIDHVHHAGNSSGIVDGASWSPSAPRRWASATGSPRARGSSPPPSPVPSPPSCSPAPPPPPARRSPRPG
ncbi:hypothetical protein LV779_27860 [Streptomyces thinghirensis]|nr:hypothetical protein [Streptomyces thinghirensis]